MPPSEATSPSLVSKAVHMRKGKSVRPRLTHRTQKAPIMEVPAYLICREWVTSEDVAHPAEFHSSYYLLD